jgi:hypothetical protein
MKRVKEVLSTHVWMWNIETYQVLLRREWGKRNNNGGNEPNQSTIYLYVEISQRNPFCNYHILIKHFFKNESCSVNPSVYIMWSFWGTWLIGSRKLGKVCSNWVYKLIWSFFNCSFLWVKKQYMLILEKTEHVMNQYIIYITCYITICYIALFSQFNSNCHNSIFPWEMKSEWPVRGFEYGGDGHHDFVHNFTVDSYAVFKRWRKQKGCSMVHIPVSSLSLTVLGNRIHGKRKKIQFLEELGVWK